MKFSPSIHCLGRCLGAALILAAQAAAVPPQAAPVAAASCAVDTQIPPADRANYGQIAMQFVQTALSANPAADYANFTAEAQQNTTLQNFTGMLQQQIVPMGPFTNVHVAHIYAPRLPAGAQQQRVACGSSANPATLVEVAAKPAPQQAHVIVEGTTTSNTWAFVLWLLPEAGHWRVQYFHVTIVGTAGKSALDALAIARVQVQRHHIFNACMYYVAAMQFSDRGPFLQLGIQSQIQKEIDQLHPPPELQGQPPFTWKFGTYSFKILDVGPLGIGGKIYLNIDQELARWIDDNDADRQNKILIAGFKKAFPEYTEVFVGLLVAAHEAGTDQGFRTVDETPKPAQ